MVVGLCLEVEGKMLSRTEGDSDDSLIAGNASANGPVIIGVVVVMNHQLQETGFPKGAWVKYSKDDRESAKGNPKKQRPGGVKPAVAGAAEPIKPILANFKNDHSCIGEDMHPDGMVVLTAGEEDGTPFVMFFQDASEMEKC
ncbi:translationally-controlled tumor protein-like [Ochotona princeps]|uniref:translationally-controlled tumor protein-like n=1 Tax=Ochotona princeps TaxID=9978 RepID=UPI00271549B9|nr:translationally-controlled tumor protein-like [Ochotona princeps]